MRARSTRRPLCERVVRVSLGGKGKRVKQHQTDMIQLRRDGLQSVKVRRRSGHLTARMGFRHPHVAALLRHLLATLALGRCHRSEEHTSELQSQSNLVCRLLLEKKNITHTPPHPAQADGLPCLPSNG